MPIQKKNDKKNRPTVKLLPCPRCRSKRVSRRVDGGRFCERCGQRWKGHQLIPSADKRQRKGKIKPSQLAFPDF